MLKYIKWIFGEAKTNYSRLVKDGAQVVDVRSTEEYKRGHIKGSINIPVDMLNFSLGRLPDKHKPIITSCASGIRSASAKTILESN